ncbi:HNH endonuclease signature motif containing protein [Nocardioides sp. KR10-350]|uniref:HNH endonuclease signature motif containing protein n=1 Tax=Nocardioides cheoyonin TaxID=3156615 RepID=UPI0032B57D2A
MRKAIRLRDRTCRAEGCDVLGTWADVHHLETWSEGGATSIENGILFCRYHHQRIHDPRYQAERRPDGRYRIILRT